VLIWVACLPRLGSIQIAVRGVLMLMLMRRSLSVGRLAARNVKRRRATRGRFAIATKVPSTCDLLVTVTVTVTVPVPMAARSAGTLVGGGFA
jgi:hypothetical protein